MKNKLNGVLLLDKPLGVSSNFAMIKVRKLLNAEKAGHTGTLDPLATGLLPICFGEATKFAAYLLEADKEYIAKAKLGIITTTGDSEGEIVSQSLVDINYEQLQSAMANFVGMIKQTPPMFSALKHNGRPLYEYAREGIEVERETRQIHVHQLELLAFDGIDEFSFRALVSKGTYIRTLAEDIGNLLGCGASLIELKRTKTNNFSIDDSYSFDKLSDMENIKLLPIDVLTENLPRLDVTEEEFAGLKYGNIARSDNRAIESVIYNTPLSLYYRNHFIGIANIVKQDELVFIKPKRLLRNLVELSV